MRKRFDPQLSLGQTPIGEVQIPTRSRDEVPAVLAGLKWIFTTPELNEAVFALLEQRVIGEKKATGRPGMDLWHILVLGVVRLARGCDYDQLEHTANYDTLVRQIMGISTGGFYGKEAETSFHQRTLSENVCHLDETLLAEINALVVEHGLPLLVKKNEAPPVTPDLQLKTDSYVFETNIHHPTDCNLLWDAARKSIDLCVQLAPVLGTDGWRKHRDWRKRMKGSLRHLERTASRGGRAREGALEEACHHFLGIAREIEAKVSETLEMPSALGPADLVRMVELRYFYGHLVKHIDLVERRLLGGERIPHEEKVFSLFEPHTEMIKKGKARPPIEFGHRLMITSTSCGLVVDYKVLGAGTAESAAVEPLVDRLALTVGLDRIASLSFDKGFSCMAVRLRVGERIGGGEAGVIMPKKGRPSKASAERESEPVWVGLLDAHSAVESDINALEQHGLDCCPDRGEKGYRRYVGLGILSYNLHKIGNALLRRERDLEASPLRSPAQRSRAA